MAGHEQTQPSGWRVTGTHALGNVFLGIAIGLLGYYFLTDALTGTEQRALVAELPPAVAQAAPRPAPDGPRFDFEGWAREDRAYWVKLKEGQLFGRIVAPRMGLDSVVVKGTSRSSFDVSADIVSDTPRLVLTASAISYSAPSSWLAPPMPSSTADGGVGRDPPPESGAPLLPEAGTAASPAFASLACSSASRREGSRFT